MKCLSLKSDRGYTLIELLVVSVIIGVLVLSFVSQYNKFDKFETFYKQNENEIKIDKNLKIIDIMKKIKKNENLAGINLTEKELKKILNYLEENR